MKERHVRGNEVYSNEGLSPEVYNPRIDRYYRVFKYLASGFVIGLATGASLGLLIASGLPSLQSLAVKSAVVFSMSAAGAFLGTVFSVGIEEMTRRE